MIDTLPTKVVLQNDRFGGDDRGAVGTGKAGFGRVDEDECFGAGGSSPTTISWRSWAHCPSLASGLGGYLWEVSKKSSVEKKKKQFQIT